MKRRKIWLGLGTAMLVTPPGAAIAEAPLPIPASAVSASTTPQSGMVVAQNAPRSHARSGGEGEGHAVRARSGGGEGERGARAVKAKVGGEGGEAGARAAKAGGEGEGGEGEGAKDASLEPSLRFYRDIQRIRGHLLVGDELVKEGRWKEALAHFQHPEKEIYGKIRGALKTYDVPPFATALQALAKAVNAKKQDAYGKAFAAVDQRLAAADTKLRAEESNWPYFAVETAIETLRSAADEYEESIGGGRIRNVTEYQDAHGFVMQAERLVNSVADELTKKDAEAAGAIRAAFTDLKTAFPSATPPQKPVKELPQVLSEISRIELQLGRFR
jgi:hypothetical protein